jgi:hypothetical protein
MLDPPDDDEEFIHTDYDDDVAIELYDIDEESANASSNWQNSRDL